MKQFAVFLAFLPLFVDSQINFWNEDFGTGCNQAQGIGAYLGPNGTWTVTNTGTNAAQANQWYISAMENGNEEGECGTGCGNDRTLHLGNTSISTIFVDIPADQGASYYEGLAGFCGVFPCGATDKRAESPLINCTGYTSITVEFLYIEGGNSIDNATIWYYDGSTWGQIADMGKTFSSACTPQGLWTTYSIVLPPTADNNSNVKIGFRWLNNEDGDALDPSFAIDDIAISGNAPDTEPPVVTCGDDLEVPVGEFCSALLPDVTGLVVVSDNQDPSPILTQDLVVGYEFSVATPVTITATDASGNSASCILNVVPIDLTPPMVSCPSNIVVNVPFGTESALVNIEIPVASDNCGSYVLINDYTGDDDATAVYPVGETLVIFTATDNSGNSSSCSFTVNIVVPDCCPADYNCNGVINIEDLLTFMGAFGTSNPVIDLTGDDLVNVSDLLIFIAAFGNPC